jgi:hypothetical protein
LGEKLPHFAALTEQTLRECSSRQRKNTVHNFGDLFALPY